ncbi:hypothetical protein [uncultured Mediterranean phage uvDeep-CGR2-KM23-C198]|nr:hypothetical protein [uncultured Mediterranean phage uvDeep-CGR2-KM23-C198]
MDGLSEISQIVGPLGVLVIVVIWSVVRVRNGNEKKVDHSETLMMMMQGVREDMRELRAELRQHFQDHAKI